MPASAPRSGPADRAGGCTARCDVAEVRPAARPSVGLRPTISAGGGVTAAAVLDRRAWFGVNRSARQRRVVWLWAAVRGVSFRGVLGHSPSRGARMPRCGPSAWLSFGDRGLAPLSAGGYDVSRLDWECVSALYSRKARQEGDRSLAQPSDHPGATPPLHHWPIRAAATMRPARVHMIGACSLMGEPSGAYDLPVQPGALPPSMCRREGAR